MIEVTFSPSFKRAYKKFIKNDEERKKKYLESLKIFLANPFDVRLKLHKLTGKLSDQWSFTVEYDVRILLYFETENKVVFINIGTHDEVY